MKRALLVLLAIAPALAEDNFNNQLNRAESTYERDSTTALLPEYERYITELSALERTLVAAEDFEGAALVQTERLRIRSLILSVKSPPTTKRRPHTFQMEDAASSGNTLTWTPKAPIAPGGYKVSLEPESEDAVISEGFHTAKPGETLRVTSGKTISISLPEGTDLTKLTLTPGA